MIFLLPNITSEPNVGFLGAVGLSPRVMISLEN